MNVKKRLLSLCLACAMLLSIVPVSAVGVGTGESASGISANTTYRYDTYSDTDGKTYYRNYTYSTSVGGSGKFDSNTWNTLPSDVVVYDDKPSGGNASVDGTAGKYRLAMNSSLTSDSRDTVLDAATKKLVLNENERIVDYIKVTAVILETTNYLGESHTNKAVDVMVPYTPSVEGRTYTLYHYNASGTFSGPISASIVKINNETYLKFSTS